eukprot:g3242.t1
MKKTVCLVGLLGVIAGGQAWTVLQDTDFRGNDRGSQGAGSAEECADACAKRYDCAAVSWNGPSSQYHDGNCNFKCAGILRSHAKGEQAVVVHPLKNLCHAPSPPPTPLPPPPCPPDWRRRFAQGDLLLGAAKEPNGHVGNGYRATFVQDGWSTEYVAGLFNGKGTASQRAAVPLTAALATPQVPAPSGAPLELATALDLERAAHLTYWEATALDAAGPGAGPLRITRTVFAHRAMPHVLAAVFDFEGANASAVVATNVTVSVPELRTKTADCTCEVQPPAGGAPAGAQCALCTTKAEEEAGSGRGVVATCYTAPGALAASPSGGGGGGGATALVLSTLYSSVDADAAQPNGTAPSAAALLGRAGGAWAAAAAQGGVSLLASHAAAARALGASRIEVAGDGPGAAELARVVNASMYALLSAVREGVFYSSSPGGLATNSYHGHAFWDVETWMWPNWLLFHPALARDALRYRADRLARARANAAAHGFGGAMFPWESAFTGAEVDPAPGTTTEEHLQGDIAFAFYQYWQATRDLAWLRGAYPVFEGIAQFWASKAVPAADGSGRYSIPHIMGPDEYHGDVTDSVYCNVVARLSIQFADELAPLVGRSPNGTRTAIGDALVIEFDPALQYHPEFAGYKRGTKVKQADTILLGYPLMYPLDPVVKRNDLLYYANVTDPAGPAMTWSMHAVGFLDLGRDAEAAVFFRRGYADNALGPFHFWRETKGGGGAMNFITGAGGFLQSVWAGYGGCRFANGTLTIARPRPPPNATVLTLRGVHFLGTALDVEIGTSTFSVALSAPSVGAAPRRAPPASAAPPRLELVDTATGTVTPLSPEPARFASATDTVLVREAAASGMTGM